jgi:hypothetical protein
LHALLQLAQVELPSLGGEGPDDLRALLTTAFVLFPIGFVIGVLGHLTGIRALVAAGVALILLASAFFVIAVGQFG